jgi:hypothetical protein
MPAHMSTKQRAEHSEKTSYLKELLRINQGDLCVWQSVWVEMAGLGPQQAKSSGLQVVPGTRRHALQSKFRVPGVPRWRG